MFEHLFAPITINGMILKNRIAAVPTSDPFEEKALGGAAMVIAGHAILEPGFSSFARSDEPWPFEKYEREAIHERVMVVDAATPSVSSGSGILWACSRQSPGSACRTGSGSICRLRRRCL